MAEVEQVIDIRDPEINVEEIMNRIRERIRQRRAAASAQGLDYDHLVDEKGVDLGAGRLGAELYYDLHKLKNSAESVGASLAMRDRKIPIFNFILYRIEHLLHRLVVKYVNIFAGRQIEFNRTSTDAITDVVKALEESKSQIDTLEKEIKALRERFMRLQKSDNSEMIR